MLVEGEAPAPRSHAYVAPGMDVLFNASTGSPAIMFQLVSVKYAWGASTLMETVASREIEQPLIWVARTLKEADEVRRPVGNVIGPPVPIWGGPTGVVPLRS